jgi:hypothetical protein
VPVLALGVVLCDMSLLLVEGDVLVAAEELLLLTSLLCGIAEDVLALQLPPMSFTLWTLMVGLLSLPACDDVPLCAAYTMMLCPVRPLSLSSAPER